MKFKIIITILAFVTLSIAAEDLTQTVRGRVYDATTLQPLVGANVVILDTDPLMGASTNQQGEFRIPNVPVGRITVKAMYIGYHPAFARNVLVYSGKEMHLRIELEQKVIEMQEITVEALPKYEAINDMAVTSARMFTVEETDKYAGSRGDVARMASNYAGVAFSNDSRNDIVIRGNSPAGLLWRLNGVDIPNPNHFAMEGTTGGPVGMLNNNTLANSDFFTGAYPAEYGNALSGVFDLRLRNGNNDEYEYLGQVGFNGFEIGAEGPISRKQGSSFLGNYRYSTLDMMDKLGIDFGAAGIPRYQDFSGKIAIPLENGRIDWFALWGTSEIAILDSESEDQDFYSEEGQDLYNGSTIGASGLSYTRFHNKNTSSRFTLSGTFQKTNTDIFKLQENERQRELDDNYIEYKASFDYVLSRRFSNRWSAENGLSLDQMGFDLDGRIYDFEDEAFYRYFDNERTLADGPLFSQVYSSWKFKQSDDLIYTAGGNLSHFGLNGHTALDPRLGVSYALNPSQTMSLAYGKHSRLQWLSTYYFTDVLAGRAATATNTDLDFTKAHHLVLGYDQLFTENLRLKAEAYIQYLYDVPVRNIPSSYSILNTGAEFNIDLYENLVNAGTGKNYGLELTLERFYHNGLYFLITSSLFDSKYTGKDGIERSTQFDTDFVSNFLLGKEFIFNERNTLFFDVKLAWAGGRPYTPIDLEASRAANELKFDNSKAFSERHPNYLKLDFKVGYRLSSGSYTQEWMIYIENLTDHKNVLAQSFDSVSGEIETVYQLGVFPMMQYRIYF
ncbi:TonB-dependent receptor plug domain-containing protein [candidate division KSB1 bacterium]|nr:TonB-dependent receptor plug domain-containing protein [candidate division KSB1 bacterium]